MHDGHILPAAMFAVGDIAVAKKEIIEIHQNGGVVENNGQRYTVEGMASNFNAHENTFHWYLFDVFGKHALRGLNFAAHYGTAITVRPFRRALKRRRLSVGLTQRIVLLTRGSASRTNSFPRTGPL